MELMVLFAFGYLIGCIVTSIIFRTFLVGTLHVDTSDPFDNPCLFLELSKGVDKVIRKTHVILKVDSENLTSHE